MHRTLIKTFIVHFFASFSTVAAVPGAWADQAVAQHGSAEGRGGGGSPHRTLLAGEAADVEFRGQRVSIPAVDRSHMNAITVGGTILLPQQGETRALPFAVLYFRHFNELYRSRSVISIFVNELEVGRRQGPLELVGHFRNYTLPGGQKEVVENREVKPTSVRWGTLLGSLGAGVRVPVAPYQVDNDLRVQLLGRVGYLYGERTHDSGPQVVVPQDTWLYGARLRARVDTLRRNLLELPHLGISAGVDVDYLYRDRWGEVAQDPGSADRRRYLQVSGHFMRVGAVPWLSERDRVLVSLHGGITPQDRGDRFNAFTVNGGPYSGESEDLARPHYTGIIYDDVRVTDFATASVGYRRELAFFLYASAVGSYIWADRATVRGEDQVVFQDKRGASVTVALDSGFFWKSAIYLAYTWESGWIRNGKSGSGIAATWNKLF